MFKIIIVLYLILTLALGMTACGGKTVQEETDLLENMADPTADPVNTCEANGHAWVDATCETPETCAICGETDGEALGHTWIDANYQTAQTCSVCNAQEGEPLVTYFEESGLDARILDRNGVYELPITCYQDESKNTIATVTVLDYHTIPADETHEALEGYEWKVMTIQLHVDDENAQNYGFREFHYLWTSRYDPGIHDEEADNAGLFTTGVRQTYLWNGIEYDEGVLRIEESASGWQLDENNSYYYDIFVTVSVRVPIGYDELIFGLEHTGWDWPEGNYLHEVITENALLFRFD